MKSDDFQCSAYEKDWLDHATSLAGDNRTPGFQRPAGYHAKSTFENSISTLSKQQSCSVGTIGRAIRAIRRLATDLAPGSNSICKLLEHFDSGIPVDASISNTDTTLQASWTFGRYLLVALVKMRLNHDANDTVLAFAELVANVLCDLRLVLVVLLRVACNSY